MMKGGDVPGYIHESREGESVLLFRGFLFTLNNTSKLDVSISRQTGKEVRYVHASMGERIITFGSFAFICSVFSVPVLGEARDHSLPESFQVHDSSQQINFDTFIQ
jgi:hypothetical protein